MCCVQSALREVSASMAVACYNHGVELEHCSRGAQAIQVRYTRHTVFPFHASHHMSRAILEGRPLQSV
jgi:hypothetical protein